MNTDENKKVTHLNILLQNNKPFSPPSQHIHWRTSALSNYYYWLSEGITMVTGLREPATDRIHPASKAVSSQRIHLNTHTHTHTYSRTRSKWDRETTLERQGPIGWHLNGWKAERMSSFPAFMSQFRPPSGYQTGITLERQSDACCELYFSQLNSYIFASAEQREIKATRKQRLQIYTIRPAAPNQPLRQQRSRRGNVCTASVHVKWEAHSRAVCVRWIQHHMQINILYSLCGFFICLCMICTTGGAVTKVTFAAVKDQKGQLRD